MLPVSCGLVDTFPSHDPQVVLLFSNAGTLQTPRRTSQIKSPQVISVKVPIKTKEDDVKMFAQPSPPRTNQQNPWKTVAESGDKRERTK